MQEVTEEDIVVPVKEIVLSPELKAWTWAPQREW
jgi:hypothetical protein